MNQRTAQSVESLGGHLGHQALVTLIRICPETRQASEDLLDKACEAMRQAARPALDQLLADANAAPWMSNVAFATAVLTIAHEGAKVIKAAH